MPGHRAVRRDRSFFGANIGKRRYPLDFASVLAADFRCVTGGCVTGGCVTGGCVSGCGRSGRQIAVSDRSGRSWLRIAVSDRGGRLRRRFVRRAAVPARCLVRSRSPGGGVPCPSGGFAAFGPGRGRGGRFRQAARWAVCGFFFSVSAGRRGVPRKAVVSLRTAASLPARRAVPRRTAAKSRPARRAADRAGRRRRLTCSPSSRRRRVR